MMNGPQGAITANLCQQLDTVGSHIAHLLVGLREKSLTRLEASKEAEAEYCDLIYNSSTQYRKGRGPDFWNACTPGYYNNEGNFKAGPTLNYYYPGAGIGYGLMLQKLREEGKEFEGLLLD